MKILLLILLAASCASKPKSTPCLDATETVNLSRPEAEKIQGHVAHFLSDAKITQEVDAQTNEILWRFTNMPDDSVYHKLGLREGDGIYKTNLGKQTSSLNLISDLSGIATGTTNCLYVKNKAKENHIIKIILEKK